MKRMIFLILSLSTLAFPAHSEVSRIVKTTMFPRLEKVYRATALFSLRGFMFTQAKGTDGRDYFRIRNNNMVGNVASCPGTSAEGESPLNGSGTAFLVKKNIVVTARHNLFLGNQGGPQSRPRDAACEDITIVFDVRSDEEFVPQERVYRCKNILKVGDSDTNKLRDYLVVELDRNVQGIEPLQIRKSGAPAIGTEVFAIGHAHQYPMKVSRGKVKVVESAFGAFSASTVNEQGMSGGPVVDASGVVQGLTSTGFQQILPGIRLPPAPSSRPTNGRCLHFEVWDDRVMNFSRIPEPTPGFTPRMGGAGVTPITLIADFLESYRPD